MRPDIGIESIVFMDGIDVTRMLNRFASSNPMEALDSTRFGAQEYSREFVAALRASGIALTGFHPALLSGEIEEFTQQMRALKRGGQDIMIGVGNMAPGNLVLMAKSLGTEFRTNIVTDALMTAEADFQVTSGSPGLAPGIVLLTPHGSDGMGSAETQTLVFTDVAEDHEHALRATGGTEAFVFTPDISNAALKAGIEGLPEYDGQTVTVTGTLTTDTDSDTGETLYSGTLTVAFSEEEDAPELEVLAAEVQELVFVPA